MSYHVAVVWTTPSGQFLVAVNVGAEIVVVVEGKGIFDVDELAETDVTYHFADVLDQNFELMPVIEA